MGDVWGERLPGGGGSGGGTMKTTTPLFGILTIEPLRCCLCGKGIEAGKMVGGRIGDMVHPDCLTIDPFAEVVA